jgi:hypothetical protein
LNRNSAVYRLPRLGFAAAGRRRARRKRHILAATAAPAAKPTAGHRRVDCQQQGQNPDQNYFDGTSHGEPTSSKSIESAVNLSLGWAVPTSPDGPILGRFYEIYASLGQGGSQPAAGKMRKKGKF